MLLHLAKSIIHLRPLAPSNEVLNCTIKLFIHSVADSYNIVEVPGMIRVFRKHDAVTLSSYAHRLFDLINVCFFAF